MRSLIIFLLLAVVCLGVASCPAGHKSFGGSSGGSSTLANSSSSSDSSSGGLFGGVPPAAGAYVDVGNGWESAESYRTGNPIALMAAGMGAIQFSSESEFNSKAVSARTVKIAVRAVDGAQLSPMEYGVNLYKLTLNGDTLLIDDRLQVPSAVKVKMSHDQSLYTATADLSGSGYYVMAVALYAVWIKI
jgi:hypothetical protein